MKRSVDTSKRRKLPRLRTAHSLEVSARVVGVTLALALLGLLISSYLTYAHMQLRAQPGWRSACHLSDAISCDLVLTSSYGTPGGIPLPAWGVWFYSLTAFIAWTGVGRRKGRLFRSVPAMLTWMGLIAVLVTFGMTLVTATRVQTLCAPCVALFVANVGLLAVGWLALRRTGEGLLGATLAESRYWQWQRLGRWSFVSGALTVLVLVALISVRSGASVVCEAATLAVREHEPITLVVYADFQNQNSRALNRSLRPVRDRPGVNVISRQFPLEASCNPRMRGHHEHLGACLRARAAICAGMQGRYPQLSDDLFDQTPTDQAAIVALGNRRDLDMATFGSCLESDESLKALSEDLAAAARDDVRTLPTIVVNGRTHVGPINDSDVACIERAASAGNERTERR